MTYPRSDILDANPNGYYLLTYRCVRRAFLCGFDRLTGIDYDHRRQWFVDRLQILLQCYAVDLLAYTLMSNHYHLVARIDEARCRQWSDEEVWRRWNLLRGKTDDLPPQPDANRIAELRERLGSLSWFMRSLNEHIARRANLEDECTGRFWEGRFKSIALLDEASVLGAAAYVDLNPLRAGVVDRPEDSPWTSIAQRVRDFESDESSVDLARNELPLMPLGKDQPTIGITLRDYLQLIDAAARQQKTDRRGALPPECADILQRLESRPARWLREASSIGQNGRRFAGSRSRLRAVAERIGQHWVKGVAVVEC